MGNCELVVTEDGFDVGNTSYLRLEVAARLVGLHPQSLQRLRRYGGAKAGTKLGRILYFTTKDMEELGYPLSLTVWEAYRRHGKLPEYGREERTNA